MKFLVDQNLPLALVQWLRATGHEATHVREVGLARSSDELVVKRARSTGEIIITCDADYAPRAGGHPAMWLQIVWVRLANPSTAYLLERWDGDWAATREALEHGADLVEIAEPRAD